MSAYRYDGAPLTRGEFITHMERLDETLHSIDVRVGSIEERLSRRRRLLLGAFVATSGRILLVVASLAATFLAARYGLPVTGW